MAATPLLWGRCWSKSRLPSRGTRIPGPRILMDNVVIRVGQDADERHLSRVIQAVRAAT
ncbi:hypothetical protein [Mesorhizobium humile]|uniref:Transposase n=1 Tax=Mesorhizobium humile TaxID=3072313 RepID=A0ABU4YN11_9HYPH|nr:MULTISPECIES: hypothetical protein [unclassified Mesorhizobium]MDX8487658.1 hypothetical protein [Mesorhizobium sp. VK2B]